MIVVPSIDLMGGRCVRLEQGDFTRQRTYAGDPGETLADFAREGAEEAHVVDLDGARACEPRQHDFLARLLRDAPLKLQLAGGFRTLDQVRRMLDAGAARVVIGSLALEDPGLVGTMFDRLGADRIALALDVRLTRDRAEVATYGWTTNSGRDLHEVIEDFPDVRHLLVTDIGRDGMLDGPNVPLMARIASRYPAIELQASGGVASLKDLADLAGSGAKRAIVGKAIWEGQFTVARAVAHARG